MRDGEEAVRKERARKVLQAVESLQRTETPTLADELIPNTRKKIDFFFLDRGSEQNRANALCKSPPLSSLVMQECFDGATPRFGAGINKGSGKERLK